MNTRAHDTQKYKSQSAATSISQKQNGGESNIQFVNNRPEAIAQRKLQDLAHNSPRVKQFKNFQDIEKDIHKINKNTISRKMKYAPNISDDLERGPIQLYRMSHGTNLGYVVNGHQLFLNSHLTTPEQGEDFHPHCTTQVSIDRQYMGSIRTYYNPRTQRRYQRVDRSVQNLDQAYLNWAHDTHATFIRSLFGN